MTPSIPGAPDHELYRSPAAERIAKLAAKSGLLLSHFEHRVDLELPDDWMTEDRPDLGTPQGWQGGVLPETKYGSFQHDRIIGSFHPGHRAKWTTHELCHGLVGFAWYPGCSRFFQALSARMSEILPVALYYFFDEAGLRRCPVHDGRGALFGHYCADCEAQAQRGPVDDPQAHTWHSQGRAFIERELDAIRRSLHLGRMVPHHHHSLELASDGLGYAAAHGPRLDSPAFARFVDHFCIEGQGWFSSLNDIQARIDALTDDLCGGQNARAWDATPWTWIVQDIGWRLLQVEADCGGNLREEMDRLILHLAENPNAEGVNQTIQNYVALTTNWVMPAAEEVFATGYNLPNGYGHGHAQLATGIESALPMTYQLLGADQDGHIARFADSDTAIRTPIGHRFRAGLDPDSPLGELAQMEAALVHAPPCDLEAATLRGEGVAPYRLRAGVSLLRFWHTVDDALDPMWRANPTLPLRRDAPLYLALFREPDGEVQVLQLSAEAFEALSDSPNKTGKPRAEISEIPQDERNELMQWGVLIATQSA